MCKIACAKTKIFKFGIFVSQAFVDMCKIARDQSEILKVEIFLSQVFSKLHMLKAKYSCLEHLYLKHLLHVIKVMAREDVQLWLLLESETAHLESQVNMTGVGEAFVDQTRMEYDLEME